MNARRNTLRKFKYASSASREHHPDKQYFALEHGVTPALQSQACEGPWVEAEHCLTNGLIRSRWRSKHRPQWRRVRFGSIA
ncbi:hypothetical protein DQM08_05520 [Lactiplantibacillus paraplantarum]|nr:hypothetical protein DQM08_05520 [Lactiplantibacillus paraplantarum]